jgi:tetratricopeptide (TPR) repeat protein
MGKKKKSKGAGASKKKSQADEAKLPDKQKMKEFMARMLDAPPRSPLQAAQEIIYDAWDAPTRARCVALAKKALEISPDCADAYVLLAEESARSLDEAMELYRKGVEAGERALGKKTFKEDVGYFWGILKTRPYMRARAGLAMCLWEAGETEEAVKHYWGMLRLNPNDNQGIRDLLMPCLIELGRDGDAEKLFLRYKGDPMAVWRYSRALLDYRNQGDSPRATAFLKAALSENKHVPLYLLGRKKIPRYLPDYHGIGDENEAILYAYQNTRVWKSTPGALDWLGAHAP